MNRRALYLFFVLFSCIFLTINGLCQQNLATPFVKNYPKGKYNGGLQNWDIAQDETGKMYFANNGGLLIFDGVNWELFPVKNKTIVRSLLIAGEKIYVGSQGDFGYFEPTVGGKLKYYSLKNRLAKAYQNFDDIWNIIKTDDEILFRTSDKIFSYRDTIELLQEGNNYSFLSKYENSVFVQHIPGGLYEIKNSQPELLSDREPVGSFNITGIVSLGNERLISVHKSGIFQFNGTEFKPWETNAGNIIKKNRINHILRIDNEKIGVATSSGGLFILDNLGQVLHHFNVKNGLQSNDVLKIFKDGTGNLWLALGNGIDYIEISSPFSLIIPDTDLFGTGYSVKIHQDKIYFGVSGGLYTADWKSYYNPLAPARFRLVQNSKGQVWDVDIHQNEVLIGHHDGTFQVQNNQAVRLSETPGTWMFSTLKNHPEKLISGNYSGLNAYIFKNGQWTFSGAIKDSPAESCRIIAEDEKGVIWAAHPYKGVYRIVLDAEKEEVKSVKLYNSRHGFPSNIFIHVFKIGNGVVFTGEYGIFEYNDETDSFLLSEQWGKLIPTNKRVHYLNEDKEGNIWFVVDHEVGVFRVKDTGVEKQWERHEFPEMKGRLVGGFEKIFPYDENNVFFPMERGFMHLNPTKIQDKDTLFQVHLNEVKTNENLVVYRGWETGDSSYFRPFNPDQNEFSFRFGATDYSTFFTPQFQYFLTGSDSRWSEWSEKTEKEYTSLSYGKYEFKVRAKNGLGQVSEIKTFRFEILPPLYASRAAFWIYFLLILSTLVTVALILHRRFEKEKEELKEEQVKTTQALEKMVAKNEEEISELQKEKMRAEIQFKNQELAMTTMHLVQKGELINKLLENLQSMISETKEPKFKRSIRSTINLLNQNANLDDDWEQFAMHFDRVHANFIQRLSETYPQLTPKDQRLCTYLRMNLSSKEIMLLMHISVRGIESSRYRLRKKLGLGSDVNLSDFLMRF